MNITSQITRTLAFTAALVASVLLASGCSKMKMARHEQRADKYFADGDFSSAEIEYLNTLRINHTNSHAIARLGIIYFNQGCLDMAYRPLAKAVGYYPNDLDLRAKLGIIEVAGQKYKEAREDAAFILDRSPTNSQAPRILAYAAVSTADQDQARKRLESLSKKIGQTASVELAFGHLCLRAGNASEAEDHFKRALAIDPKFSAAYFNLGHLYAEQNKLKEAEEALKSASDFADARSSERIDYANFKMSHGQLAEGKRLLEDITKAAPDYVPAWIRQAQIAIDEKRPQDAQSLLDRARVHDPNNYDALLMQGRLYLVQKQPDKATAIFQHMAVYYSRSAEVQFHLALTQLVGGDASKAISTLNQALVLDPNYPDAILTLAQLNIEHGNPASAVASLSELVRRQPQLYQAHLLLANAYVRQNNANEALAVYSRAQGLFPKDPQIPLLAGVVFSQQNKLTEARKCFEIALALAPHSSAAVAELVNLDLAQKQYSAALNCVATELGAYTNAVTPHLLLAKIHQARALNTANETLPNGSRPKLNDVPAARDDVNQAEAELLKAISLSPDLTTTYLQLAQLYVAAGKEHVALDRLNELAAKTNSAPVYMEIGEINDALTNYPAARDAYEKVLTVDSNSTAALNNLAYLYSERLGQVDKAYPLAERANRLLPADPEVADTFGWILFKRGEYNRALGLLDDSSVKLPSEPEIQFHLGMTYYMSGEEDSARAALERSINSSKKFSARQEASRRLAVLDLDPRNASPAMIAQLEKSLESEPNDPITASRLAAAYENHGALDKAAKTYEQVLAVNPQNARIMGRLASLYLQLNNLDKALQLAKQAHQLSPEDALTSWTLGRLVFRSGDYPWALSLLQETADKLPSRSDVLYDLAWSYYSMGAVENAESSMQKALPALSGSALDDARCFLKMVSSAKTTKDDANRVAALQQASQVLATNADYVPATMLIAIQSEQGGKFDDAIKLYEKALVRFPGFSPAARNFAILAAQHAYNDQKAFELGMKARKASPDDAKLTGVLGILAYRLGDYSQSAQLLKEADDAGNKDGELLYYLGKANYQLKQKQKSKDAFQRALALNLKSDLAEDARKVLAELKQN